MDCPIVAVDIGTRAGKAVACLVMPSLAVGQWIVGTGDPDAFSAAVAALAKRTGAIVLCEDQHIRFVATARKLIEARIWVKVRCADAGVPYEEVLHSKWQAMYSLPTIKARLVAAGIRGTKKSRKMKEKARFVAEQLWPTMQLSEDQIDAALIGVWRHRFAAR